jgi:hypothetical protein
MLAWTKARLLSRNELLPADGLDEQRAARSDEFKRLGDPDSGSARRPSRSRPVLLITAICSSARIAHPPAPARRLEDATTA